MGHIIVNDDCSIDSHNFKNVVVVLRALSSSIKLLLPQRHEGMALADLISPGEQVVLALNTLGVALAPASKPVRRTTF